MPTVFRCAIVSKHIKSENEGGILMRENTEIDDRQDKLSILIPTQPFHQLKIGQYKEFGRKKKLFKGESLVMNARTIDDLYFVYVDEGRVSMVLEQETNLKATLTTRTAGNAFMSQYNGYAQLGPYDAHMIAEENSVVFIFTQRDLLELIQKDPDLFYEYVNVAHMNIAQFAHRLSIITNQRASTRLTMWLSKLCALVEPEKDGSCIIPCNMTLNQLADYLSIHITTCTKLIATLEDEGIIHRTRSNITVLDPKRLETIGWE